MANLVGAGAESRQWRGSEDVNWAVGRGPGPGRGQALNDVASGRRKALWREPGHGVSRSEARDGCRSSAAS